MLHEKEIIKWSTMPDYTKVWYRSNGNHIASKWKIAKNPGWLPTCLYIVDNIFAPLRMQQADGIRIEFNQCPEGNLSSWNEVIYINMEDDIHQYRIRQPKAITKWQWIMKDENNTYKMTSLFYSNQHNAQDARQTNRWTVVEAYLPTQKTFEE